MKHKHHKMKAETRYITFDGATFVYPEDAEHYEIMRRLQVKRNLLADMVGHFSRQIHSVRDNITRTEKYLHEINGLFQDPEFLHTRDHVAAMSNRMQQRIKLKRYQDELKSIKQMLAKLNPELSHTDNLIRQRTVDHDEVVFQRTQLKQQ